ncbi:NADPH-dependent F420 reductase [Caldivirga maquilingensis]|uniref:NADP oxidoreductase coenzyme F420-dependent n=1 Tax=Caldivirga maquilingensis (strain ATCC 700844 / DSM 13496 / JCM 10307 / IC-167) TaxID=397948 RepID=A8M9P9_CALMQ|nr:NAD(P)-binding domain-containing protein [Caldivirga maquilingensis]ABW00930.1 NADP oxidoreductase coenzyme F420-dependent [Caldivirga maquilingensis IC-167]
MSLRKMRIGVLGTGEVGQAIATKLVELGNEVRMGSRSRDNEAARNWARSNGSLASHGTFRDAAEFGEIIFNCTNGLYSLDALKSAGYENLKGKIIIDVANAVDFSSGEPTVIMPEGKSLGERIQEAFPESKVVKTLNFVSYRLMVNPGLLGGEIDMFVSGNNKDAKQLVTSILKEWFGWRTVVDLGDIRAARAMELLVPLWFRLWENTGTDLFGFKVIIKK